MRVRIFSGVSVAALVLFFAAQARQARADVVFSNFGPSQTYVGNSWWNVGSSPGYGTQVNAFSFAPTQTATLTGADLPLAVIAGSAATPLVLYIESNSGGQPGTILDTMTQNGTYPFYPTTAVVNFTCSGSCSTLDAGTTYWIVGQQTDSTTQTGWLTSFDDTGTWYYDTNNSATGPWTVATKSDKFGAFDVTGTAGVSPVPEPSSLALLGSGLVGILAVARRKFATT